MTGPKLNTFRLAFEASVRNKYPETILCLYRALDENKNSKQKHPIKTKRAERLHSIIRDVIDLESMYLVLSKKDEGFDENLQEYGKMFSRRKLSLLNDLFHLSEREE